MAHYALINENNEVVQVITGVNENITQVDIDGTEVGGSTEAWEAFYESRSWFAGLKCKRTSYNKTIRKNYAGIGFTYDEVRDAFIPPKPFSSWIFNEETCLWEAPITFPEDSSLEKPYIWDEETLSWKEVTND